MIYLLPTYGGSDLSCNSTDEALGTLRYIPVYVSLPSADPVGPTGVKSPSQSPCASYYPKILRKIPGRGKIYVGVNPAILHAALIRVSFINES